MPNFVRLELVSERAPNYKDNAIMKIILLGYGKMGKAIEGIALERGHDIVGRIDRQTAEALNPAKLRAYGAQLAIEFSTPQAAPGLVSLALEAGLPVVSGTTAWEEGLAQAKTLCQSQLGALFHASNFSVGVYMFNRLNRLLAQMMRDFPDYKARLSETHHTQKLDAPSGTAILLANTLMQELERYQSWQLGLPTDMPNASTLPIEALRIEGVPGTHHLVYDSPIDRIELVHTAHSRMGFAAGAVHAAEWLLGRQGCFGMADMLGGD